MINYISTRGYEKSFLFSEVILKGIAPDGGLFVPEKIPKISSSALKSLVGKSYQEICLYILNLFETDFPSEVLKKLISQSYTNNFDSPQIAPLIHLRDNQYVLELWHGPTSAFKDMALQFLPHLFSVAAKETSYRYLILTATSGDTGKAALEGYKDKGKISVMVFFPKGGVSQIQELSMLTQEGNNVWVTEITGDFDDAQQSVKEVFNDTRFNQLLKGKYNLILSSANSINWGRLLPQIIYHTKSYVDLVKGKIINIGDEIDIAVPTGNFGNILAAYYAKVMGLPIRRLICATNANNVYTQFLKTGIYDVRKRKMIKTPSPAMNILIGSNLERLLYALTKDTGKVNFWMRKLKEEKYFRVDNSVLQKLKKHFYADWVTNSDCFTTIKKTYKDSNYLLDPHTAVAKAVADRYQKKTGKTVPLIICSTAHWSKFAGSVYSALTGVVSDTDEFEILEKITKLVPGSNIPRNIAGLQTKKIRHSDKCGNGKEAVEKIILQYLAK